MVELSCGRLMSDMDLLWTTTLAPSSEKAIILHADGGLGGNPETYLSLKSSANTYVLEFYGSTAFKEAIFWRDQVFIGYGDEVYRFEPKTAVFKKLNLGKQTGFDYFCGFYPNLEKESLVIATGTSLFKINREFDLVWETRNLGADGVNVQKADRGVIYGEGEWDPPGGWRPFRIDLRTGKVLPPHEA